MLPLKTAALAAASTAVQVSIDPAQTFGVWEGWGTSLCWWANVYGQRDDLADIFFTLDNVSYTPNQTDPLQHPSRGSSGADPNSVVLPGLGFNIARYNIGGSLEIDQAREASRSLLT